ncbi:MAG: Crp/Fnr family transcriptional regulator, partial [Desulfamplus sp.]|nr:Crp/Fnr family transcriptional regulator [Desulfamplus sp.]
DLKKSEFLQSLTDEMLEKLLPITEVLEVESREIIFNEGDPAKNFYLVKSGRVLLEQKLAKDVLVNVRAIDPGEAFGLSVVLNKDNCAMTAICDEAATLFVINGNDLCNLMEEDHSIGYLFMQHTSKVLHKRWLMRTEQFIKTLKTHPDISALETM